MAGPNPAGTVTGTGSAYACATVARLKTRHVVADTAAATTNATQYGAVMPKPAAIAPPSTAPAQLPPAAMNRFVLPTRPSISGGVSRCRSEAPTMLHSDACMPNMNIMNPTTYGSRATASVRCSAASTSSPTLIVQVAVTHRMSRWPNTAPMMPPTASQVNSVP